MRTVLIALFGIVLPAVTLAIELSNGMCAEVFFNPIPTLWHIALVAAVPALNLLALVVTQAQWRAWRGPMLWANAVALGIALVYALAFAPISPIAVFAILVYGMGLLPLSPLCAVFCGLALRGRLRRMVAPAVAETPAAETGEAPLPPMPIPHCPPAVPPRPWRSLLVGGAVGVLMVLALEARITLTLVGLDMAASDDHGRETRGVDLLRRVGDRDVLLRACYGNMLRSDGPLSLFGGSHTMFGAMTADVPADAARRVYFRVTGEAYNAVPPPKGVSKLVWDDFDFDEDLGGNAVAGRLRGLSLASSRIDSKIYADAAVSYTEWTLVFHNEYRDQREARAQILLPPGGVVSRVTLWIDGEPREAAFAGSAQVRDAYKKVVAQRRDPVLVTWAGNDRVLVQCFPVPPNGDMKIRLGITAPLVLPNAETAALQMPSFAERNFSVASRDIHSLWIESDRECQKFPQKLRQGKADEGDHEKGEKDAKSEKSLTHVVRGTLADDDLTSPDSAIVVPRRSDAVESWTPDTADPKLHVVQNIVAQLPLSQQAAKQRLIVVVDGSCGIRESLDAVVEALASTPDDVDLRILVAGDTVTDVSDASRTDRGPQSLAVRLRAATTPGGCDNAAGLLSAFDETAPGHGEVVWIHAAQPVPFLSAASVVQWLERDRKLAIYDVPVATGPNRLVEQLGVLGCLRTVPRFGALGEDLKTLLARLSGREKTYRFERRAVEGKPPESPRASSHLARLWAADQVAALAKTGRAADRAKAVQLAAAHQLVTQVSGAVVLENQKQYDDANLKPVDPDTAPNLPEPATWIILLTALPWMLWKAWRRRGSHIKP